MFNSAVQWLIGLLFPTRCLGCKRYDDWLCPHCMASWPRVDGALSYYQVPLLQRAIHLMKYKGYAGISQTLGRALASHIPVDGYDIIVPVPMHWRKRWQRGYNQTMLLAQQFPKPVWPALKKVRATRSQAGLNKVERQHNLTGSFQVTAYFKQALMNKRVLLLDDVYSTGATTRACATQLLKAGVASVDIAVVAVNVPWVGIEPTASRTATGRSIH